MLESAKGVEQRLVNFLSNSVFFKFWNVVEGICLPKVSRRTDKSERKVVIEVLSFGFLDQFLSDIFVKHDNWDIEFPLAFFIPHTLTLFDQISCQLLNAVFFTVRQHL